MTTSQQSQQPQHQQPPPQPAQSPKYYTYGYPSTPTLNVMGVYAISHASAPSPESAAPAGPYTPGASALTSPISHYRPAAAPAEPEPAATGPYAYNRTQFSLGASPPAISPIESPLQSPGYYFSQIGSFIPASRSADGSSASLYPAQQLPQPASSPPQLAVSAAPPTPASPYYARQSRRMRRKSHEEVTYAMNYPSHAVPEYMYVATGPPDANWRAMPPKPEEIRERRYATGVDERNFFTVLEYKINDQPIIWDYYTGYVHLTGIWKAIGHAKADIVKLLDNSPELEPIIKRVRGGFLKIQGTWVPFGVAHRLAKHICYYIRYALVPMFGPEFPDECTKPDEPGFGELHLNQPYAQLMQASPPRAKPAATDGVPVVPSLSPLHHAPSQQHARSSSFSQKLVAPQGPLPSSSRHTRHYSDGHASHDAPREALKDGARRRRESGGSRPRALSGPHHHHHHRSESFNSIRRAIEKQRIKIDTSPDTGTQSLIIDSVDEEVYDENVFEDDDPVGSVSPPPMPRKLSFRDEQRVSESPQEFLEMLKATRSLQQISAGSRAGEVWNRTGGGFECAGRQFRWDGSDHLEVILDKALPAKDPAPLPAPKRASVDAAATAAARDVKRELTPPTQHEKREKRIPSLATILNMD